MITNKFIDLLQLDAIGGDLAKIRKSVRSGRNTAIFSATLAEKAHIAWGISRPILYVVKDNNQLNQTAVIFKELAGDRVATLSQRDDNMIFRASLMSSSMDVARIKTLCKLAEGEQDIVVVTPQTLHQYLPEPQSLSARVLALSVGIDYNIQSIIEHLSNCGYTRRETLESHGEFTLRGDILSIFPINSLNPIRISFFDERLENIKSYDIDTLDNLEEVDKIKLYPVVEMHYELSEVLSAIESAKKDIARVHNPIAIERMQKTIAHCEQCLEGGDISSVATYLMPYFKERFTIMDYMPKDTVVVYDDGKAIFDRLTLYHREFVNRHAVYLESGEVLSGHIHSIMSHAEVLELLNKFTQVAYSTMSSSNPIFRPSEIYNLKSTPVSNYFLNFQSLYYDMRSYNASGYRVIISCGDEYTAKHIKGQLFDENIYATACEDIDIKIPGILCVAQTISHGFIYKFAKLIVIGRDELIRRRESAQSQSKKRQVFTMPKCGDYVVHELHGIGLCSGVERIKQSGYEKDYVVINYQGTDKLYVPVDQLDRLSRYSGSDVTPKLSKIGGKDFQKAKDLVKSSVKEMAINLVELYKLRQEARGFKYSADTVWQQEFESSFEWTETQDQIKSIAEIKEDMEKGIVMDRLLCGDVGYGKTEVALRAVFKTVMDGKQAAILAPTAILARQHYNTAMARFNEAKLKCVLLTRFQTKEETARAVKAIKSGEASVVIGTHRLLSKTIEFQDLGLLVLDEEQRFGVEHKEKLKLFNNNINVLTLSATPIPRTLNMALTGIRDISVLETPPRDRLPIQTYVTELSDGLIEDAINREIDRDGQVFVLYNKVEDIEVVAEKIRRLVPRSRVIVGHAQMSDVSLENAINSFYNKEGNVLVATTIIENGIDLPDANTLIVYNADKLGLSALYQLRGRVGRSNRLAYAYFTTRGNKVLTEDALKRLTAIMDYTDFGSGFKIAMRDLEIRGAGNVLGREQSGHIIKVGYDMYCKLLKEAVEEVVGANDDSIAINNNTCEMNIDLNSYLDASYIENNNEKIKIYKSIADISSESEKNLLIARLSDAYGIPSESLLNLIEIALVKNLASAIGAKRVSITKQGAGIIFDSDVYKNKRVILAVSANPKGCVLSATNSPTLVFESKNLDIIQKLQQIKKFLLNLTKNL